MKLLQHAVILIILLGCSVVALADQQRYQIELIIFSHMNANGVNSEQWPIIKSPDLDFSQAQSLSALLQNATASPTNTPNYQILSNFNFNLNNIGNKLIQTPGYNVVMHIAWDQPIDTPANQWVHIFGGTGYDDQGNVMAQDMDGSADYTQATHWQVDGLIKINTQRFINTTYNLLFATPTGSIQDLSTTNNFSGIDAPLTYFRLDQSRRMRSNELNYIGHPLYGVLINITKAPDFVSPDASTQSSAATTGTTSQTSTTTQ